MYTKWNIILFKISIKNDKSSINNGQKQSPFSKVEKHFVGVELGFSIKHHGRPIVLPKYKIKKPRLMPGFNYNRYCILNHAIIGSRV